MSAIKDWFKRQEGKVLDISVIYMSDAIALIAFAIRGNKDAQRQATLVDQYLRSLREREALCDVCNRGLAQPSDVGACVIIMPTNTEEEKCGVVSGVCTECAVIKTHEEITAAALGDMVVTPIVDHNTVQ